MIEEHGLGERGVTKTRIFISYSRKDAAFADRLVTRLNDRGYQAFLDRDDIADGEPWKERLEQLILQADAVAFVISPDSVSSPICDWETKRTLELGKRLIPLSWRQIDDQAAPHQLTRLNYIFVDTESKFEDGVARLCAACDVDIGWVREHTRMVELAERWTAGERRQDALLRGAELSAAEIWLAKRQPLAPSVPEVLHEFLQAARLVEVERLEREHKNIRRMRRLQLGIGGAITAAAVLVVLAGLGVTRLMSNLGAQRSSTLAEFAKQAADEGRFDRAARFAMAGIVGADSPLTGFNARDSEWELRRALAGAMVEVLAGHTGPVRAVAFGEGGDQLATASDDGTVRIWDAASGRTISILRGAVNDSGTAWNEGFSDVRFNHTGRLVVTASRTDGAQVWDLGTERELFRLGPDTSVKSAAFSRDGTQIVTASLDGAVRVWDISASAPRELRRIGWGSNGSLALSPDGSAVLTSTGLRHPTGTPAARLWALSNSAEIMPLPLLRSGVLNAIFGPDGSLILTASEDGIVRLWDAQTGQSRGVLPPHQGSGRVVAFDRRLIATGSEDGSVRLFNVVREREVAWLRGHEGAVTSVAFSPDGARLATASVDGNVRIWRVPPELETLGLPVSDHLNMRTSPIFSDDGEHVLTTLESSARLWNTAAASPPVALPDYFWLWGASLSRDGRWAAVAYDDGVGRTRLYDMSGRLVARIAGLLPALSDDGTRIVTTTGDGLTRVWSIVGAPREIAAFPTHRRREGSGNEVTVESSTFSGDGRRVVTVFSDRTARVWSADDGSEIAALSGTDVGHATFSPDGTFIVTIASGGTNSAAVWDLSNPIVPRTLQGHEGEVIRAAFSPDGTKIITASADGTARIWDARAASDPLVLRGHVSWVHGAAFHPRHPLALTWGDTTVRLWSTETGLEVARLDGHQDGVAGAAFTGDGLRVLSASWRGEGPRVWVIPDALRLSSDELADTVCGSLLRNGASRFSSADFRAAIVLDRILDADVCSPPPIATRVISYLTSARR